VTSSAASQQQREKLAQEAIQATDEFEGNFEFFSRQRKFRISASVSSSFFPSSSVSDSANSPSKSSDPTTAANANLPGSAPALDSEDAFPLCDNFSAEQVNFVILLCFMPQCRNLKGLLCHFF
jgi:hypothetical protein